MDATDRLPVIPVDEVRARPDDVGRTPAELSQGGEDDREAPARLGRGIRITRSVRPDRGSAADEDPLSDPHGAAEPDPRLERRSRRHPATLHGREVSRGLRSRVTIGRVLAALLVGRCPGSGESRPEPRAGEGRKAFDVGWRE
jgi:hypothetical protein